jgi:hypothetical protein
VKRCSLLVLLAASAAAAAPVQKAHSWPSFRGTRASGVAEGPAPAKWNGETPAIADGVIYGRGLKHLFAIGAR